MIQLKVNGESRSYDGDPNLPLLWYLRDVLGLTGTKFGCGMALCGACTVHQDGQSGPLLRDPCEQRLAAKRSPPSKPFPRTDCIPCSRNGSNSTSRNAATARPDRSCRPFPC